MATITKLTLSGATDGLPIAVSATAGVTTIHTGHTSTTTIDEVWVYACNSSTAAVTLTIEWGASASQLLVMDVPPRDGGYLVVPGYPLMGRIAGGTVLKALASTSNVISLYGHVNRIT